MCEKPHRLCLCSADELSAPSSCKPPDLLHYFHWYWLLPLFLAHAKHPPMSGALHLVYPPTGAQLFGGFSPVVFHGRLLYYLQVSIQTSLYPCVIPV